MNKALIQLIVDPTSVVMNPNNIDDVFLYRLYQATQLLGEMFVDRVEEISRPEYSENVVRQESCFQLRRSRSINDVTMKLFIYC